MMTLTSRLLQSIVFFALGLYFLSIIGTGTFYWYLSERFLWLTVVAALGFLLMAVIVVVPGRAKSVTTLTTEHHHADHEHADAHSHEHEKLPLHRLVIVAIPLVLGVIIPARPLSASAISNKDLNSTAPLAVGSNTEPLQTLDIAPNQRNVLDWVRAFNFSNDPEAYTNQSAEVVGFIYQDARLPTGQFLVGRFAVTHCVAEAVAIGMIVEWPGEIPATNTWVRVSGFIKVATLNEKPIPLVKAASVQIVDEPSRPYLFP